MFQKETLWLYMAAWRNLVGNRGGVTEQIIKAFFACLTEAFGFYTEDHRELLGNYRKISLHHGKLIVQVRRLLGKFL